MNKWTKILLITVCFVMIVFIANMLFSTSSKQETLSSHHSQEEVTFSQNPQKNIEEVLSSDNKNNTKDDIQQPVNETDEEYMKKNRISDDLSVTAPAKLAVAEYYKEKKIFPKNNEEAGIGEPNDFRTKSIDSVEVEDGKIIVTFNNIIEDNSTTMIFIPNFIDDSYAWDCKSGTLSQKYRPIECQ